jgi:hypothetical protein
VEAGSVPAGRVFFVPETPRAIHTRGSVSGSGVRPDWARLRRTRDSSRHSHERQHEWKRVSPGWARLRRTRDSSRHSHERQHEWKRVSPGWARLRRTRDSSRHSHERQHEWKRVSPGWARLRRTRDSSRHSRERQRDLEAWTGVENTWPPCQTHRPGSASRRKVQHVRLQASIVIDLLSVLGV